VDELHISATPNVVHDGDEIELFIDSTEARFKNADEAVIRVFEVDDASPIDPQPGRGKLVVTFHGRISDNTFELVPRKGAAKNPEISQVKGSGPKVKIKVDQTMAEVTLPDASDEQGVFEMRVQIETLKPNRKKYTSDYKVLVRWFQHYKAKGTARPVITFLAVHKQDAYLNHARAFWRRNADAVVEQVGMSLEAILDVLDKEGHNYGPWGQINIVMHGRARQLTGKALKQSPRFVLHRDLIDEELAGVTLSSSGGIDADTQIVFRACNAGKDLDLVRKLHSEFFAGDGKLFIPKFTQIYQSGGSIVNEFFEESLEFDTPGSKPPPQSEIEVGLKNAWDGRSTPGKGGKAEDEIKTFTENHDWVQDFALTLNVLEQDILKDDGSQRTDDELVKLMEKAWFEQKWHQKTHTWETKPDRWKIRLAKKSEDTKAEVSSAGWLLRITKGKGTPMMQQIVGSVGVGTSSSLWTLQGTNVADQHANIILDNEKPDHAKFKDLNSGKPTTVRGTGTKALDITGGGEAEGHLPATLTVGTVTISIRRGKVFVLEFQAKRHWVDRRRDLRVFDSGKPYKDRQLVKPDLTNSDHFGSD
jgi:hypothetical protein